MKLYRYSSLIQSFSLLLFISALGSGIAFAKPLAPLQVRLAADFETLKAGQLAEFVITVRSHGQDGVPATQLNILSDDLTQCKVPVFVIANQYSLQCRPGAFSQAWIRVEVTTERHGKQWQAQDQYNFAAAAPPSMKSAVQAGVTKWRGDRRIVEYGL